MRALPAPEIAITDVLTKCIAGTTDPAERARLEAVRSDLVTGESLYEARAKSQALHLVPRVNAVGGVPAADLSALYSEHLSATNGAARSVYDQIRNAAPNKRCPLCGAGTVAALDHHLPKSKYPDLAILPTNLVPACHYCNDAKKARYPKTASEQTLHPYYDGHLRGQWLRACVAHGPPVAVNFNVLAPPSWNAVDAERALRHFTVCKLAVKFASNAADELIPVRDRLQPLWTRGGSSAVEDYLAEETACHAARPNSWQHAFYQALSNDDWFINGGFQAISQ